MDTARTPGITERFAVSGNLALQEPLHTLWDEFADAVSGELRLMGPTLEE